MKKGWSGKTKNKNPSHAIWLIAGKGSIKQIYKTCPACQGKKGEKERCEECQKTGIVKIKRKKK